MHDGGAMDVHMPWHVATGRLTLLAVSVRHMQRLTQRTVLQAIQPAAPSHAICVTHAKDRYVGTNQPSKWPAGCTCATQQRQLPKRQ
jgi:hypothetical protein